MVFVIILITSELDDFFNLRHHEKVKRLEPKYLFFMQKKPSIWCKLGGKSMPFGRLKHVSWVVKAC